MQGFYAPYVPGWDCHGLPIELKVDQELGSKKREMSKAEIRKECRAYAGKWVEIQSAEFQRLGVFGDWEHPYLTMTTDYEAATARELARFAERGGLYKGKKPVHWCSSCVTALAEAEVEYADHTSPSIYVKFPFADELPAELARPGRASGSSSSSGPPPPGPSRPTWRSASTPSSPTWRSETGDEAAGDGRGALREGSRRTGDQRLHGAGHLRARPSSRGRTAATPSTSATRCSCSATTSPSKPAPAASTPPPATARTTT